MQPETKIFSAGKVRPLTPTAHQTTPSNELAQGSIHYVQAPVANHIGQNVLNPNASPSFPAVIQVPANYPWPVHQSSAFPPVINASATELMPVAARPIYSAKKQRPIQNQPQPSTPFPQIIRAPAQPSYVPPYHSNDDKRVLNKKADEEKIFQAGKKRT